MNSNNEPLVSIIIVNYNGKAHLKKCLDSIKENSYKEYEIILVDNNSTDGSVELVKKEFANVKIIKLDKNYGFAKPNNIGAKHATGDFLYFLNNDTTIGKDSITNLVEVIQKPKIGLCQSLLLKPDSNVDSSGDFFTTLGIAYSSKKKIKEIIPILSARGAAMMVKRDIFWDLDGFDQKFFASFEDVDLGWRAWIRGYEVVLVPTSIVYHSGGKTIQMLDSTIRFHGIKNTLALCITNFETLYVLKSLLNLFCIAVTKKVPASGLRGDSEDIFNLPSFGMSLQGIKWVLRNFKYVSDKRKKVNSQRVRSTKELIELGLITSSRK